MEEKIKYMKKLVFLKHPKLFDRISNKNKVIILK